MLKCYAFGVPNSGPHDEMSLCYTVIVLHHLLPVIIIRKNKCKHDSLWYLWFRHVGWLGSIWSVIGFLCLFVFGQFMMMCSTVWMAIPHSQSGNSHSFILHIRSLSRAWPARSLSSLVSTILLVCETYIVLVILGTILYSSLPTSALSHSLCHLPLAALLTHNRVLGCRG